jgi:hypothetical protein
VSCSGSSVRIWFAPAHNHRRVIDAAERHGPWPALKHPEVGAAVGQRPMQQARRRRASIYAWRHRAQQSGEEPASIYVFLCLLKIYRCALCVTKSNADRHQVQRRKCRIVTKSNADRHHSQRSGAPTSPSPTQSEHELVIKSNAGRAGSSPNPTQRGLTVAAACRAGIPNGPLCEHSGDRLPVGALELVTIVIQLTTLRRHGVCVRLHLAWA